MGTHCYLCCISHEFGSMVLTGPSASAIIYIMDSPAYLWSPLYNTLLWAIYIYWIIAKPVY